MKTKAWKPTKLYVGHIGSMLSMGENFNSTRIVSGSEKFKTIAKKKLNCEKQKNFGFQWVRILDRNCAHGDASSAAAKIQLKHLAADGALPMNCDWVSVNKAQRK